MHKTADFHKSASELVTEAIKAFSKNLTRHSNSLVHSFVFLSFYYIRLIQIGKAGVGNSTERHHTFKQFEMWTQVRHVALWPVITLIYAVNGFLVIHYVIKM